MYKGNKPSCLNSLKKTINSNKYLMKTAHFKKIPQKRCKQHYNNIIISFLNKYKYIFNSTTIFRRNQFGSVHVNRQTYVRRKIQL